MGGAQVNIICLRQAVRELLPLSGRGGHNLRQGRSKSMSGASSDRNKLSPTLGTSDVLKINTSEF